MSNQTNPGSHEAGDPAVPGQLGAMIDDLKKSLKEDNDASFDKLSKDLKKDNAVEFVEMKKSVNNRFLGTWLGLGLAIFLAILALILSCSMKRDLDSAVENAARAVIAAEGAASAAKSLAEAADKTAKDAVAAITANSTAIAGMKADQSAMQIEIQHLKKQLGTHSHPGASQGSRRDQQQGGTTSGTTGAKTCSVLNKAGEVLADFLDAKKNPKGVVVKTGAECLKARDDFTASHPEFRVIDRQVLSLRK